MAVDPSNAVELVRQRAQKALVLLERWVRQNSYTAAVDHVNRMGDLLAEAFALPGLSLQRHAGVKVGDHLVWRSPAWGGAVPGVLLVGHHDTVFPPGAFEVWERGGTGAEERVRGPGVIDMKGGLAVVWSALAALAELGGLVRMPIAFVSVADEETGSVDSRELTSALARQARAALVFESGRAGDAVITRRKGVGSLRATAHGRAAHAGNAHAEGKSAIRALARFVDGIEALNDYDAGTTVNVGLMQGGEAKNTVPGHAVCEIDFRVTTAERGTELLLAVDRVALDVARSSGVRLEVEGGLRRPPLERSPAAVELYQRYAHCARAAGLGDAEAGLLGGGSDANIIAAAGTPAIDGLGPRGKGFHTHDEFLEIATLAPKAEALVRFLIAELPGV